MIIFGQSVDSFKELFCILYGRWENLFHADHPVRCFFCQIYWGFTMRKSKEEEYRKEKICFFQINSLWFIGHSAHLNSLHLSKGFWFFFTYFLTGFHQLYLIALFITSDIFKLYICVYICTNINTHTCMHIHTYTMRKINVKFFLFYGRRCVGGMRNERAKF